MVVGKYEDLRKYAGLCESFDRAFDFMDALVATNPEPGHYVMPGCEMREEIFANVISYETKPERGARAELHRKYIDVQVVLEGEEVMLLPLGAPFESEKYLPFDEQADCGFIEPGSFIRAHRIVVPAGCFAIFFPGEEHAPSLSENGGTPVKKMVLKVMV